MSTSVAKASQPGGSSISLPPPKISLRSVAPGGVPDPNYNRSGLTYTITATGQKFHLSRMPFVTAEGLPPEAYARDLRLEFLWYKNPSMHRGKHTNGWKHPAHIIGPSADENMPLGHNHLAVPVSHTRFSRGMLSPQFDTQVSEWSVLHEGQGFFLDSIGNYMAQSACEVYDSAGNSLFVDVMKPRWAANTGSNGVTGPAQASGHSGSFKPLYFSFRYSVQGLDDPRNRINGPQSPTMVLSHRYHPFIVDRPATAAAAPGSTRVFISQYFQLDQGAVKFATRRHSK